MRKHIIPAFCLLFFFSSCLFERHFESLDDVETYETFKNLPATHQLNLLRRGEAGQTLDLCLTLINGTDGKALKRKQVEVYQANAKGDYEWEVPGDKKTAKLRGMALTDDKGRIFIQTLLPGDFGSSIDSRSIHLAVEGVSPKYFNLYFCQYANAALQKETKGASDQFLIDLKKDARSNLIGITELQIGGPKKATEMSASLPDCEWCGTAEAPANISAKTRIAPKGEPGQAIVLSGKVFREDGITPAEGVIIYAYHTNAEGYYKKTGTEKGNGQRHGHLRGWVKTDKKGNYSIQTIKPAPYPSRKEPAHIHMTIEAPGQQEYWIPSTLFKGDPLITAKDAVKEGSADHIVEFQLEKDGILHGRRDIILRQAGS